MIAPNDTTQNAGNQYTNLFTWLRRTASTRTATAAGEARRVPPPLPSVAPGGHGGGLGLSNSHISPCSSNNPNKSHLPTIFDRGAGAGVAAVDRAWGRCKIWPDGSLMRVNRAKEITVRSSLRAGGGQRGSIGAFSANSRRRLMQLLGTVKKTEIPLFITLTYPRIWPDDPTEVKRHLDAWAKRLLRHSPKAAFVWKLEFQKRGAPHLHLLCWNVDTTPGFRGWLSQSWYEVVGSGDILHLKAGTRVEYIRSWRGVMSYASKYMSKLDVGAAGDGWASPGRFWGVRGAQNLPWAGVLDVQLTYNEVNVLMRAARRYMGDRGRALRRLPSLSVFVDEPGRWLALLDALPDMAR